MCATCGCRSKKKDKAQDKKAMSGMSPKQKASFKKADKAMDKKGLSRSEDTKKDKALADKIKKKKK
jgi:hypothetical protein